MALYINREDAESHPDLMIELVTHGEVVVVDGDPEDLVGPAAGEALEPLADLEEGELADWLD